MNTLYPIFIKTENIQIVIIGGGKVATEKLHFILKNSPNACITLVATSIAENIKTIANKSQTIVLKEKLFESMDLQNCHLVIAATNDNSMNQSIYRLAKERNCLINVVDTPEYCDFYLGSIVTKGDLKIAISTNGKSPTMSKRLREFFETILPDSMDELILNLNSYRNTLKGNLEEKVNKLNEITATFLKK
ncbi:MAG TPA: bifunctional precorrin-2 dehydrogenase/sirohydrochlorin ferrochelatase [Chitinophagales bacterium]|jgi:precorrin-2 dehydrogenase/sirohydrochlorin ferrochelatase|nr:bifunctional precorrin-2 dehydrogenase/sirohydrochlorin ferrochelatase [Chitinophagales bacterium]MBP6154628.1 bifunctional precorrin-2 dehydrogenase/sirohydrochlorin ferrochelatase [Chitinophagales bacterium]HQV77168.1 bifunctional precorrin-2 dehydrogenase/sirohydrochlorin ferrochelatase [Chitinophagales bacterium]HQW79667.1 bifunctional precorrin-2 dehydrogenase/sirohydrochlorin ferrochelatase [Chitinophagales bacterium]